MSFVLTLVSSRKDKPLTAGHLAQVGNYLAQAGMQQTCQPAWIEIHKAADIGIADLPDLDQMAILRRWMEPDEIDCFALQVENRRKKLLLADMDSTIVEGETLDELAARAGLKDQVAAITSRAMEGRLDFRAALRERVSLLKGLREDSLAATLADVRLNPAAAQFVGAMRNSGTLCVLVTGGFTYFSEPVARKAGFNKNHANTLVTKDGILTGGVADPILDKDSKLKYLHEYCAKLGIGVSDAMAIGDGANDIPMLTAAGFGVGYKPRKVVAETVLNLIVHGDFTAALYAQGMRANA